MECVGKQDKFSFRENFYKNGNAKFINWIFGFKNIHDKPGIILSSGKNWQQQRRFALRNLKDLGLGNMEIQVVEFSNRGYKIGKIFA